MAVSTIDPGENGDSINVGENGDSIDPSKNGDSINPGKNGDRRWCLQALLQKLSIAAVLADVGWLCPVFCKIFILQYRSRHSGMNDKESAKIYFMAQAKTQWNE